MNLHYKTFGEGDPLIILHGLLGMLDNWQTLARRFAEDYRVITVDLRNHGRSGHYEDMDYPIMAKDVIELMDSLGIEKAHVIGHSMGGKVAMQMAVSFPDKVQSLISVDISPKRYAPGHEHILEALSEVDPSKAETRSEMEDALMARLGNLSVVRFLMKNLTRCDSGGFEWKMNLSALVVNYDKIIGEIEEDQIYDGPALFIRGGKSNYVRDDDMDRIRAYFPNAELRTIANAGHWVHAEQPDELYELVNGFLTPL